MKKTFKFFTIFLVLIFFGFTACSHLSKKHSGELSDHFNGDYFHNLTIDPNGKRSAKSFLTWLFNRNLEDWKNLQVEPDRVLKQRSQILRVTWINHATTLIQLNGKNVLTDPIWSERAGPLNWVGPKRTAPPPIDIHQLPPIDVVVVSHNHYDHMDLSSLKKLNDRDRPIFIVPLANRSYLKNASIERIIELDWWETHQIGLVKIVATPAQHWSKRTLFDANRALWSGFYIQGDKQSVFFAGDTAYQSHFTLIRKKLGSPTVSLMPIGAYKPQWFMKRAHTNPEEAVIAHKDLSATYTIPIHYGTFRLGDDSPQSALKDLQSSIEKHHASDFAFKRLKPGETLSIQH